MVELVENQLPDGSQAQVKRAKFRSVQPATMRALNRIHKPRQALDFQYEGRSFSLSPIPIGHAFYLPYRFALGADTVMGPLDLDRYLVKRLIGLIDPDLAEAALDDDTVELALKHVLAEPLDQFEKLSGQRIDPKLIRIEPSDHTGKTALDFGIRFAGDEEEAAPARARLWLPYSGLPAFSLAYDQIFPARRNDLPVFLPMHLLAGSCRLPLSDMRQLEQGDVLILEDVAAPWPSAWLVVARKRRVALRMDERKAHIIGTLEHYMSEQQDSQLDDGAVDDLEIEIKFELGRAQMPLRQLQMLADGGVIPLERDYSSPVDVVVGGRRVGEGEIVDIDGRIGVRLVRFAHK